LREAARSLSDDEARFLVDAYYMMQRDRIRAGNQVRALSESKEPNDVLTWLGEQSATLETQIKGALGKYSQASVVGAWAESICGIGPVLSAGLLAHIDIQKAPTVGHIWRFAGLDPTVTWEKKNKRPWNARLKTLCWKIGESFVKVSGNDADVYGKVYVARKAQEVERDAAGQFAAQAAAMLTAKRFRDETGAKKAYESGHLPAGHLHARAKRYAVKLFLAHWHAVAYRGAFGTDAPKPYAITALGHAHEIPCPNWPF
jgi:hypothetical protein